MMFHCSPPQGKCEWSRLRNFATHFNTLYGTGYTLSRCLDVNNRSEKEPEVLLEAPGCVPVVIECKSVSWPPDHLSDHSKEHYLGELLFAQLGGRFQDALYKITFDPAYLKGRKKKEIETIVEQTSGTVLTNMPMAKSQSGIGSSLPVPWHLRPISHWERDETYPEVGLGIFFESEGFRADTPDKILPKKGYAQEFDRAAKNAAEKFVKYADCTKLLLVQFYGDGSVWLGDKEIVEIIQSAKLPTLIDQVWVAREDWVSEYDYEIAWKRVRPPGNTL